MIVLEHIKKQYGENTVLDDISLEIGKGEIVNTPKSQFIKDFILRQLFIKRDNIFALFNSTDPSFVPVSTPETVSASVMAKAAANA